jgi:hypothetical protein
MTQASLEDQEDREEELLTEYTEAGEEFRYRDRLLHNSYYLLIVGSIFLSGNLIQSHTSGDAQFAIVQLLLGGLALIFIGAVILTHFIQRRSANAVRFRAAAYIEGAHEEFPERPLGIPYWVIGHNCRFDEREGLVKSGTFWEELRTRPTELYSAKTVALTCIWGGAILVALSSILIIF